MTMVKNPASSFPCILEHYLNRLKRVGVWHLSIDGIEMYVTKTFLHLFTVKKKSTQFLKGNKISGQFCFKSTCRIYRHLFIHFSIRHIRAGLSFSSSCGREHCCLFSGVAGVARGHIHIGMEPQMFHFTTLPNSFPKWRSRFASTSGVCVSLQLPPHQCI